MLQSNPMSQNTAQPRIPPQHLDAEKAVLGSIMLRPNALYEIEDVLSADAFYAEKHRIIFKTMMALTAKHEPIDLLSVSNNLKESKELERVGGVSYLTDLTNTVPASTNIVYYANLVQKKYTLRNLIEAADFGTHRNGMT